MQGLECVWPMTINLLTKLNQWVPTLRRIYNIKFLKAVWLSLVTLPKYDGFQSLASDTNPSEMMQRGSLLPAGNI